LLVTGVRRAWRAPDSLRLWLAAATARHAAFMAAAAIDWVWQLGAIVAAALVLGAVIVAGRDERLGVRRTSAREPAPGRRLRAGLVILALGALAAISIPLADTLAIQRSQHAAANGDLTAAYRDSLGAVRLEPYAATPRLQEALVLEASHDYAAAARAAQVAASNEPTNWATWLTLARIEAEQDRPAAALAAMARARSLNPESSLFLTKA
jgi:tetratricopeptide (TPR) repeat protein